MSAVFDSLARFSGSSIGKKILVAVTGAILAVFVLGHMIGNLLVFALMWGWLCEYAATLAYYWRDRRASA